MSDYPDLRKSYPKGDPDGPTREELREKYRLKYRKGPSKFEGPVGFSQVNFKRRFRDRYPRATIIAISSVWIGAFCAPLIYHLTQTPSLEEQYAKELRKRRFIDAGVYKNPFTNWFKGPKEILDEDE